MVKEIRLYNSLTKKKESFKPLKASGASVYACGPTVYDFAHIGNFRAFIATDILIRTLRYNGLKTRYIRNITDVGHLTDDEDTGDDKVEEAAQKKHMSASDIADFYTKAFHTDAEKLNLLPPNEEPRASDFIGEQISFIEVLEKKGFTYKTSDGLYFDTSKLSDYGKLVNLKIEDLREGARVKKNPEKKHPTDFALWKFSPLGKKRSMEWDAPWGIGFPGWHIECSAMSKFYLKFPFDIHTGGIDHQSVHHTNEIAQNEAYFGSQTVTMWLHSDFMLVDGVKMSKSLGNIYTLLDLEKKEIPPLAFRYFVLTANYRQILSFSQTALHGALQAYKNICRFTEKAAEEVERGNIIFRWISLLLEKGSAKKYRKKFLESINDDLNTPQALAVLWEVAKDASCSSFTKIALFRMMDEVLGLSLPVTKITSPRIPDTIKTLAEERHHLRKEKKWGEADAIRRKIEAAGFFIKDDGESYRISRRS